jgi:hypothetical protein
MSRTVPTDTAHLPDAAFLGVGGDLRLMSAAARASRVEPDLRPLPGAWR